MLERSQLIRHQIYFWQSYGAQWLMPINEFDHRDELYVNVLVCVSLVELELLPKYDTLHEYMVPREIKSVGDRKKEVIWELPKDKFGMDPFYKHYCLKKEYLDTTLLIPIDVIHSDYPELIANVSSTSYPKGIDDSMEKKYKREFLLKEMLK